MNTSETIAANAMTSTLFDDIRTRLEDAELGKKQRQFYSDLLGIPEINLTDAEKSIHTSVQRVIQGFFGAYLAGILAGSFKHLAALSHLIDTRRAGPLRALVLNWHRFLHQAVVSAELVSQGARSAVPAKFNLVGFNTVEDTTLYLDQTELNELVAAVAAGSDSAEILRRADQKAASGTKDRGGNLEDEATEPLDVLALLLLLMQRVGLKPNVKNPELQSWLIQYFERRSSTKRSLGGAAGNECFVLHELGLPALLHTPNNHDQQAKVAPPSVFRLEFDVTGNIRSFKTLGECHDTDPDGPRKFSFVFQVTPKAGEEAGVYDPSLLIDGRRIQRSDPDRVIFQLPNARTREANRWSRLRLLWKDQTVEVDRFQKDEGGQPIFKGLSNSDWPWLPLFQQQPEYAEDGTLLIRLTSPEEMQSIAPDVRAVLLGGLQRLGSTVFTPAITALLKQAVVAQLQAIDAPKHYELSGVSAPSVLDELKQLFQSARIVNIGINREELVQITSQYESPYYVWPRPVETEPPFVLYMRARKVIEGLGCETLYVHDPEMDLLLASNSESSFLEKQRQAMLTAKVVVPVTLLRRAERPDWSWDFVLSGPALLAVIAFADQYARWMASSRRADYDQVFNELVERGFHAGEGLSVAIAPALHFSMPPEVSLSGAGDMCFAVRAALASHPDFNKRQ